MAIFKLPKHYIYPTNQLGVIRAEDYGIAPNIDCTTQFQAAIQAALTEGRRPPIYLPVVGGTTTTYLLSDTIRNRLTDTSIMGGWRARLQIVGEDRDLVVIKLIDGSVGFESAATPKAMIYFGSENDGDINAPNTGGFGNQGFRNSLYNLTLDTGNNPGAIAVDWLASNIGTLSNLKIQGNGTIGIRCDRTEQGPALIGDCEVIGFNYAVHSDVTDYQLSIDNLTIRNQAIAGIRGSCTLAIHKLRSYNTVKALEIIGDRTLWGVVDAEFNLPDGTPSPQAGSVGISCSGRFYGQDIYSKAYETLITDTYPNRTITAASLPQDVDGYRFVKRYSTHPISQLFPSPEEVAPIAPQDCPSHWLSASDINDPAQWAIVTTLTSTAVQTAIDSGKKYIALGKGNYTWTNTVIVRNNVHLIVGPSIKIVPSGLTGTVAFEIQDTTAPFIEFSNVLTPAGNTGGDILNTSTKPVIFAFTEHDRYSNTGTGDLYIKDVNFNSLRVVNQDVWARQLNIEAATPQSRFTNSTAWIMGFKSENTRTLIEAINSKVQLIGGLTYTGPNSPGATPLFVLTESEALLNYRNTSSFEFNWQVLDTKNGYTRQLRRGDQPGTSVIGIAESLHQSAAPTVFNPLRVIDRKFDGTANSNLTTNGQNWRKHQAANYDFLIVGDGTAQPAPAPSSPTIATAFYYHSTPLYPPFVVEAEIVLKVAGVNSVGIVAMSDRLLDQGFILRYLDHSGTGRVELFRYTQNGFGRLLGGTNATLSTGIVYPFRLEVYEDSVKGWVNGRLYAEATL